MPENLESFFLLDYPEYELLFTVAEAKDPAVTIVQELQRKYPSVSSQLIVSETSDEVNPKINNLLDSYQKAKWDLLLISDSNIRVQPYYLKRLVPDFRENIGIITGVVAGVSPRGLGGFLEASYLNTFFTRWMFITKYLGFPSVVGKSMLFRKQTVERIGGIKTLGGYIAEDYMAGHAMSKLDLRIELMRSPVEQYIGTYSLKQFWKRHLRWGRIRKSIAPIAFLAEPIFFSSVSGMAGAFALQKWFDIAFLETWFVHMIGWATMDLILHCLSDRFSIRALGAWWVREALALPLWGSILFGHSVDWRGARYRLLQGGLVEGAVQ